MTLEQILARMREIREELLRLGELPDPTEEQTARFADLDTEYRQLDEQRTPLQERADRLTDLRAHAGNPAYEVRGSAPDDMDTDPIGEPGSIPSTRGRDPWDLAEVRSFGRAREDVTGELRSRARDAIERMTGTTPRRREVATDLLERFDTADGQIARHILLTSSPTYMRAFARAAFGQQHLLSGEERDALQRAMSLTDAAGGFMIPFQLDPTLILTSDGSVNPFRQISRRVVATGDVWNGFSTTNVSWSYDAEAAESSDDATTFAQPSIPIHKGVGFVPISEEAAADEPNVATVVAELLAGGKDDLEAAAFATGSGSGQPTGIVTALGAADPTVTIASATTDTFAVADVYAVENALPARYRQRGAWVANHPIYNLIRQFDNNGGADLFAPSLQVGQPSTLLGHPRYESSAMDGVINATATNRIMVFGDFSNYVIADRLGMTVEYIPHLFATANNRPSGQRGWRAVVRHGADSVNDRAFRMLDVT